MELEDLGYNDRIAKLRIASNLQSFETGRVIAEHKERYVVKTEKGEHEAEITGNLRFSASSREDFPAVGDWVALTTYDSEFAIIHKVIPRFSVISRQAVGQFGEVQVIATNVDYALIIQSLGMDFSINRVERYLTICYSSRVEPIIVLTKTDLVPRERTEEALHQLAERVKGVPVVAVSNITQEGYESIRPLLQKGKTFCLLGSSGVGKSSIINNLTGKYLMRTGSISESTSKGKHVTSHRELVILENGAILIDNPGMREVGIVDTAEGLETTFDIIQSLSKDCRYKDCTHTNEAGCSVVEAVNNGSLDRCILENYQKMLREKKFFETSSAEKKKKEKSLGKIIKDYNRKDFKGRG